MADFIRVAKTTDIAPGESRLIEVNGERVAVFNHTGHQRGPADAPAWAPKTRSVPRDR